MSNTICMKNTAGLTNEISKSDPELSLRMYEELYERGFTCLVTDVNTLAQPDAGAQLEAQGWVKEDRWVDVVAYRLGEATSFRMNGQRAALYENGSVTLLSSVDTEAGHGKMVELITREPDGEISHSIEHVD